MHRIDLSLKIIYSPPRDKAPSIKHIISEVLTLLFNSDKEDAIREALQLLLNFFNADWVYVASFEKDHRSANFLYEVTSPWVKTSKEDASELLYETIPWMIDALSFGQDIILHDIGDLPPDAHADRELFKKQGLLSMLVIPLSFHGKISGFSGFDSIRIRRHWNRVEVDDLHLIGNIFSIIRERQYAQKRIKESRKNLLQSNTRFRMIFNQRRRLPFSLFGKRGEKAVYISDFQLLGRWIGRVNRNTDPLPTSDSTEISPPIFATNPLQIASPNPMPCLCPSS